jgi:hypothetical protein
MRKNKTVRFTYQVLNIKLISNLREGTDAYRQILENIFTNTINKPTTRGKRVVIRTMFPGELNGLKFFYGKISRYTDMENNDWLNITTKEVEHPEIDANLFPNLQETEYVFVPQAHRFIVKKSPHFTIYNAEDFFNKAIKDVISSDEDYNVVIEQSADIFEEIYRAISVEKLFIKISYTNSDDIGEDAVEWMDDELKDGRIKKTTLQFEANKNHSINLETKLIKGALGLAVENGEVEASVKDTENRTRKIITKNHPSEVRTSAPSEEGIKNVIFTQVMTKYRNGGNNS